jgi:cytochrome c biogenesis protein CcdA
MLVALGTALLLGLRHATDPDHLTAVSTLVASDDEGARRARTLGLFWGLGHAATLFAFGLPVVLFGDELPEAAQQGAELAVGAIIVALAVRLLVRWRRGYFHVHEHEHGEVRHAHPHVHEHAHAEPHDHGHPETLGRSPLAAFGIGLVHGAGGSAASGALIVGAVGDTTQGAIALAVFALGTAVSMTLASAAFGRLLGGARGRRSLRAAIPSLGALSLAFGVWYALAATL